MDEEDCIELFFAWFEAEVPAANKNQSSSFKHVTYTPLFDTVFVLYRSNKIYHCLLLQQSTQNYLHLARGGSSPAISVDTE